MNKSFINTSMKILFYIGISSMVLAVIESISLFESENINGQLNLTLLTYNSVIARGSTLMFVSSITLMLCVIAGAVLWLYDDKNTDGNNSFVIKDQIQKLQYSKKDQLILGVCGGLGECSSIPSWVWRASFITLLFCTNLGIFTYFCVALLFKYEVLFEKA